MSVSTAAILSTVETGNTVTDTVTDLTTSSTPSSINRKPYVPEGSQKRNLSIESTPSPTLVINFEKRPRHSSLVFDDDNLHAPPAVMDIQPQPTLADIMALLQVTAKVSDLEKLAKQDDLIKLQATVASQALEIQQLRDTIVKVVTPLLHSSYPILCV